MVSKKKKIVIISSMVALLIATGVLNVVLSKNQSSISTGAENESYADFFATYRSDRLASRNQSIEYLDAVIANASSSVDAKTDAQTKKLEIVSAMEQELVLEGLIKSMGYEDCVITMTTGNLNCILKTGELTDEQVAQVLGTIVQETAKSPTEVKIIPVE